MRSRGEKTSGGSGYFSPAPLILTPHFHLGAGDLLLLLLVGLIGPSVGFGVLSDPGLGWHLRVPDVIRDGGFPTADPFNHPFLKKPEQLGL